MFDTAASTACLPKDIATFTPAETATVLLPDCDGLLSLGCPILVGAAGFPPPPLSGVTPLSPSKMIFEIYLARR